MKLLCFGLGYTAQCLLELLGDRLESVVGTSRNLDKTQHVRHPSLKICLLEDVTDEMVLAATHILISIPPQPEYGDVVLTRFKSIIASHTNLRWLGYLSSTGVYGDHQGKWVDESTPPTPHTPRSKRRYEAANGWMDLYATHHVPVHIFQLSGIYGPGRNALSQVLKPGATSIEKPGQYFNRIHVADIVGILAASMKAPMPGHIFNLSDDKPSSSKDVQDYAAKLLQIPPVPSVSYEAAELSAMQQEFYSASRRVRNDKVKQVLAYNLLYPSYKEGLSALYEQGQYEQ